MKSGRALPHSKSGITPKAFGVTTLLPERVATVFMMREMDEIESKEICATLSISDSNLWVMLHRARMALRECLAANWFENPEVQH